MLVPSPNKGQQNWQYLMVILIQDRAYYQKPLYYETDEAIEEARLVEKIRNDLLIIRTAYYQQLGKEKEQMGSESWTNWQLSQLQKRETE
jgi:hypothetical protein